jgi:hypothetical protein
MYEHLAYIPTTIGGLLGDDTPATDAVGTASYRRPCAPWEFLLTP